MDPSTDAENIVKAIISESVDRGAYMIPRLYYDKKLEKIISVFPKIVQSLESHIGFLEKNIKKNPSSTKKIEKLKRHLINVKLVIKEGNNLLSMANDIKRNKLIILWIKEIPLSFLFFEYLDERSVQSKINRLNAEYPDLGFLTDNMTFESEFDDYIFKRAYDFIPYLGASPIDETEFDPHDEIPKDTRKRVLKWMDTMKKYVDVVESRGDNYYELPLGMRQYIDIKRSIASYFLDKEKIVISSIKTSVNEKLKSDIKSNEFGFIDLPNNAWYYVYIDFLAENAVMQGYDDGYFYPLKDVSVGETLKTIYKPIFKKDLTGGGELLDKYGKFFLKESIVDMPISIKITIQSGKDRAITRNETSEILAKVLIKYKNYSLTGISSYYFHDDYTDYAALLRKYKIIGGNEGFFYPDKSLSRAEFSKILYNSFYRQ